MVLSVNHTGLTVGSLDRSLAFYRDTLGLQVDPSRSGEWSGHFLRLLTGYEGCALRIAMVVADDGGRVQLEEFVRPSVDGQTIQWAAPGGGHLCLEVSDLHTLAEAIRAAGYEILSDPPEPVALPSESVNAGGFMMAVRDPDGHVVELLQTP